MPQTCTCFIYSIDADIDAYATQGSLNYLRDGPEKTLD